jgi:hypothetical protein
MSKYRTREEYQAIVRTMPAQELSSLLDTFWSSTTLTEGEAAIRDVLDAEMERRIMAWEIVEV